jgi:hypothetical protein
MPLRKPPQLFLAQLRRLRCGLAKFRGDRCHRRIRSAALTRAHGRHAVAAYLFRDARYFDSQFINVRLVGIHTRATQRPRETDERGTAQGEGG